MRKAASTHGKNHKRMFELARLREEQRMEALRLVTKRDTARMNHEAEESQRERQKEVLLEMLAVSDNIHQRDTEAILEVFRRAAGLMETHMAALSSEKSNLSAGFFASDMTQAKSVLVDQRQREISREMQDLEDSMEELVENTVETIKALQPKMRLPVIDDMVRAQIEGQ